MHVQNILTFLCEHNIPTYKTAPHYSYFNVGKTTARLIDHATMPMKLSLKKLK